MVTILCFNRLRLRNTIVLVVLDMVQQSRTERKAGYFKRLGKVLNDNDKLFIVNVDNVGSKQMQQARFKLRGAATIVMGKNTLIRKVIQGSLPQNPKLEVLLPLIRENVGFIFTKGNMVEVKKKIGECRVAAPAKAGAIAQCDVTVPAQNTGIGPEKTSFFQAMSIPTKVARGSIEIVTDVHLIKKDTKVGASEATLLNMLNIQPFTYGPEITVVYEDGCVYSPSVLDMTTEMIVSSFMAGVTNLNCVALACNYPTISSIPHLVVRVLKNLLAVTLVTDYTIEQCKEFKEYLADPGKFATITVTPATSEVVKSEPKAAAAAEPSDESDEDMGFGLFD